MRQAIRMTLLVMVTVVSLTACDAGTQREEPPSQDQSKIGLTITFQATPKAEPESHAIDCNEEVVFCDQVANGESLAPTPPNRACTMQYGGPEVAKLSGSVKGAPAVNYGFTRTNGCEISRWGRLQTLLDTLTPPITLPGGAA